MRKGSDVEGDRFGTRHSEKAGDGDPGDEMRSAQRRPNMLGAGDDEPPRQRAGVDMRTGEDGGLMGESHTSLHGDAQTGSSEHAPLFPHEDAARFRSRWTEIQTNFVDEPRRSVEQANDLVAEVTERLTSAFTKNRNDLERQWGAGDEVSTENLRQTLQRYRSFFERLLSM